MRRSSSGSSGARAGTCSRTCLRSCPVNPALDLSCFWCAGTALATVPPGDEKSEDDMQAAESGGQEPVAPGSGTKYSEAAEQHEADAHDGEDRNRECASGDDASAVKEQPGGGQGGFEARAKQQKCEEGSGDQWRRQAESDFAGWSGK